MGQLRPDQDRSWSHTTSADGSVAVRVGYVDFNHLANLDPAMSLADVLNELPAVMAYAHDAVGRLTAATISTAATASQDWAGFSTTRGKE